MYAQQIELIKRPLDAPAFSQYGTKYNLRGVEMIMKSNPAALVHIKQARTNNTFTQIFAFTGAGLVGYPLGTQLGGGDPEWAIAIVGGGLMALSIPFLSATN